MSVQSPGEPIRPTAEMLDGAIGAAVAALEQFPVAEMLASTGAGVHSVDSPAAATLVLLALAESEGAANAHGASCVRRLLSSRASTGFWRFSPDSERSEAGESARALVALRQWNMPLDPPPALAALLSRDAAQTSSESGAAAIEGVPLKQTSPRPRTSCSWRRTKGGRYRAAPRLFPRRFEPRGFWAAHAVSPRFRLSCWAIC